MAVAEWSGALLGWESELGLLKEWLAPVFGRREVKETAGSFVDGLLSGIERKTGWLMAEHAGAARPYRMQSLLGRSGWDAEALRDRVRTYAIEALGASDGVLVVDVTGFVKKGGHSVGVARQYSGTAGRIETCQVGVFLAYASRHGQALIDRRLYLPEAWTADRDRCARARVPEDVPFATKPGIARDLIAAALDAGVPCAWVLADTVYGTDSRLRTLLEERRQPYVLAVKSNHTLRFLTREGLVQTDPAFLAELAGAAGLRWTIEECFQRAKDDLGLDHCEARSWHGWHRHMTLCMAALAFLAKLAARLRSGAEEKPNETSPPPPIAA